MVQMAPRMVASAAAVLGLFAALACVQTATAFSSDISCPEETILCFGDEDCGSCLDNLQNADISFDLEFTECSELYLDVCAIVESNGCDITNALLEDFAACIAAEDFGCTDFTSCAVAADPTLTAAPTAAPTPAPMMTAAPTDAAVEVTLAPSSAEDALEANEDSGVSRTAVTAAATSTGMAFACGLALFLL